MLGRSAAVRFAIAFAAVMGLAGCLEQAAEHRLRANAFLRGDDAASALKECDLGLAIKKDDLPLLILRGKALFEIERLDDSRAAYEKALVVGKDVEPRSLDEAHLGLAMVASRQHDWTAAKREFLSLVSANGRDATSHLNVARACLELEDMPCAIEHGEAAVHLHDTDEGVLFTLGTIYLAAGQVPEADKTFTRICDVVPGAASCPYGHALVAAKAGEKDKAIAALGDAVAKKLPNPGRIAEDPGFASLRDDERFQALAARARASAE